MVGKCGRLSIPPPSVAAADDGLLAPELAAGIARVKSAKSNRRLVRQVAHPPAGEGAPERAGHKP
jgi:hypothetical protein